MDVSSWTMRALETPAWKGWIIPGLIIALTHSSASAAILNGREGCGFAGTGSQT